MSILKNKMICENQKICNDKKICGNENGSKKRYSNKIIYGKTAFKALCTSMILCIIFSLLPFEGECQSISNDVFRLHILANSDSKEDQALKLKVRDAILEYTDNLYSGANSKQEAIKATRDNFDKIIKIAQKAVCDNGYDYKIGGKITNLYFNTRYYENITMPSGMYDALQIKIGTGNGHNWWCVMYPSLCLSSAMDDSELKDNLTQEQYEIVSSEDKYVFKFKIVEYYEKVVSWFK